MKKYKGRILEVYKGYGGINRIISGIKEDKQPFYDKNFRGSNGTYSVYDNTYPAIYLKIIIWDLDNEVTEINIKDILIKHYNWLRINSNRVLFLRTKLKGKKITLLQTNTDEFEIENLISLLNMG